MFLDKIDNEIKQKMIEEFITKDLFIAGKGKGIRCRDDKDVECYCNAVNSQKAGVYYYFFTLKSVDEHYEDFYLAKGDCAIAFSGLTTKKGNFDYRFSDFDVVKTGNVLSDGNETRRWRDFMSTKIGKAYRDVLFQRQVDECFDDDLSK